VYGPAVILGVFVFLALIEGLRPTDLNTPHMRKTTLVIMSNIVTCIDAYEEDYGRVPDELEDLVGVHLANTKMFIADKTAFLDIWNNPLMYKRIKEGNKLYIELFSYGADGVISSDDMSLRVEIDNQ
jgi:hypothetical protein